MAKQLLAIFLLWVFSGADSSHIHIVTEFSPISTTTEIHTTFIPESTSNIVTSGTVPPKLKFSLYITSMSVETQHFIIRQFTPTYNELKNYLDVEFIPWGNSKRYKNGTIVCHNGQKECQGNMLYSCALNEMKNKQDKQVEFINCEMIHKYATNLNPGCLTPSGVNETAVRECSTTKQGSLLQLAAEYRTKEIGDFYVPAIVFDNEDSEQSREDARTEFRDYLCKLLKEYNLVACMQEYGF